MPDVTGDKIYADIPDKTGDKMLVTGKGLTGDQMTATSTSGEAYARAMRAQGAMFAHPTTDFAHKQPVAD